MPSNFMALHAFKPKQIIKMIIKKTALITFFLILNHIFLAQINSDKKEKQQAILDTYLKQGAYQYHYLLQGWQTWIDKGLNEDSTIAYLWEMKALPYWKTQKYDLGIACYNKAVQFDRERNLGRRGYLRCIFQKNYDEGINYSNKSIASYKQFSDAKYYKGLCLLEKGDRASAIVLMTEAKKDFENGYSINEDDSFYEPYPYKVNWYMAKWTIPDYKE